MPPPHAHPAGMFVVTEAEAAAIRAVYEQRGELSAAVELCRLFPAVTDTAPARAYGPARRAIATEGEQSPAGPRRGTGAAITGARGRVPQPASAADRTPA